MTPPPPPRAGRLAPGRGLPENPSDIVLKGEEVFEREVRPTLPPDPPDHHVIIDVDGGGWEIDADGAAAAERFFQKRPHARGYSRLLTSPSGGRAGPR